MIEKLDLYDVIGAIVPGAIVVVAVPIYFPEIATILTNAPKYPEAFVVIALVALCFIAGYILQAIASILEPLMFITWGGEAGSKALDFGLGNRYFPPDLGKEIKAKLEQIATKRLSTRSLFLLAMQRAESGDAGRVRRFNAMYAYHRVLLVLAVVALALFMISFADGGLASHLQWRQNVVMLLCLSLLVLLFWHRAKQRGYYYVREVLMRAHYSLTVPIALTSATPDGEGTKELKNADK